MRTALEDIVIISSLAGLLGILARTWTGDPWVGAAVGFCSAPFVFLAHRWVMANFRKWTNT